MNKKPSLDSLPWVAFMRSLEQRAKAAGFNSLEPFTEVSEHQTWMLLTGRSRPTVQRIWIIERNMRRHNLEPRESIEQLFEAADYEAPSTFGLWLMDLIFPYGSLIEFSEHSGIHPATLSCWIRQTLPFDSSVERLQEALEGWVTVTLDPNAVKDQIDRAMRERRSN